MINLYWEYLVESLHSEPEAVHPSSSQLHSWCVLLQLLGLITNFAAVWFLLMGYDSVSLLSWHDQYIFQLCDICAFFSACGWCSRLWSWWRLRKMARTSRQKTRIRPLPTRKPTSRNLCLALSQRPDWRYAEKT